MVRWLTWTGWLAEVCLTLLALAALGLASAIYLFRFPLPHTRWDPGVLLIIPASLGGITALVFAAPLLGELSNYHLNIRRPMVLYLLWLLPSLVFATLVAWGIVPATPLMIKLDLLLFGVAVIVLLPYLTIFVRGDVRSEIHRAHRSALRLILIRLGGVDRSSAAHVVRLADRIRQLTLVAAASYDYVTFLDGLERLVSIGRVIVDSRRTASVVAGSVFNEVCSRLRRLALEPEWGHEEEGLRAVVGSIGGLVGYACIEGRTSGLGREISYVEVVSELRRIGLGCLAGGWVEGAGEVIDVLGLIGEWTTKTGVAEPLARSPEVKVIAALEEIGQDCAKRELEAEVIEVLGRLEAIADVAKRSRNRLVANEALKAHVVVAAAVLQRMPSGRAWLSTTIARIRCDFESAYVDGWKLAADEMSLLGFGREEHLRALAPVAQM